MMNKTSKVMMTALMLTLTTMMSAQELGTGNNTTGSKSHDHRASVGVSIAHDMLNGLNHILVPLRLLYYLQVLISHLLTI